MANTGGDALVETLLDWGVDLIFGLPEQKLETWQHSMELALGLHPEHFSLYALTRFGLAASQTGYILAYVGVLSVITQGFLVGRIAERVREDILIVSSVAMMAVSLAGWALVSSVMGLLLVLIPTSLSGGLLIARGHEITAGLLERMQNFYAGQGIRQPIRVLALSA